MKKIIYPEKQTAVTSTSEAAAWPADNLLDSKPKKKWQADATHSATLTLSVGAGVQAIFIGGTNATSATINGQLMYLTKTRLWYEFGATLGAGEITIALATQVGTVLEAGVIRAGALVTLNNPSYDLAEETLDYSIITQLSSGSEHVRKRDIVRQYTASMMVTRSTEWESLRTVYGYFGPASAAMLVADAGDNQLYCGFFSMSAPKIAHRAPTYSFVLFSLKEAV